MLKNIKTAEQIEQELLENKAKEVRVLRDKLLKETDFMMSSDYPLSQESLSDLKKYRQKLRDITKQKDFPNNINFPKYPTIIKITN